VWKIRVAVVVLFGLLAGGAAAAAWHYDSSRKDRLADGIVIAGVDVGGMRVAEARAALERRIAGPLRQPISIRYKHGQFVFTPTDAEVHTNVDAQLEKALAASRRGNFMSRTIRDFTGGRLGLRLGLDVTYSDAAIESFVQKVKKEVNQKAREAKSSASFAGVIIKPSRNGVSVKTRELRRRIQKKLVDPTAERTLDLAVRVVRPDVTTAEVEKKFKTFLAVSRSRKELRLFVKEKLVKTYSVAIGRIGFETPAGLYEIRSKAVNPAWFVPDKPWAGDLAGKIIPPNDPENPLKARWMGFWDGAGIHGTADSGSIGFAASHGCIRMTVPDVIQLYDRVPLHTPLYIS
jgi:lipoprotein-anchoring transpeptidase ErfK/SrfK